MSYTDFIAAKAVSAPVTGFSVDPSEVHPILKAHQRDMVCWAVNGGRRAIFSAFGLGKTLMQLEAVRLTLLKANVERTIDAPWSRGLIILPLGVMQEFKRDASDLLGMTVSFIRSVEEAQGDGIYLTNYETVRDGKLDPREFTVVSLDEASVLRGFGGTKTFREFMRMFEGSGIFRFVATATPSPNEFIELLAYAAFLDIVDRLITQFSMEGEEVYDPFMGIGTVAQRALKLKRRARGSELSTPYWMDSTLYARQEQAKEVMPSLFDVLEMEETDAAA